MPIYDVQGVESEAGVTTSVPIEAPTRQKAEEQAKRQGIAHATVVGIHNEPHEHGDDESVQMPANELVEKSGLTIQPRIVAGWLLLLFALPAAVAATAWLSQMLELSTGALIAAELVVVAVIAALAVQMFRRFWT